jgi:hypothetical protein
MANDGTLGVLGKSYPAIRPQGDPDKNRTGNPDEPSDVSCMHGCSPVKKVEVEIDAQREDWGKSRRTENLSNNEFNLRRNSTR